MSCKPTVGEVRRFDFDGGICRVRAVVGETGWQCAHGNHVYEHDRGDWTTIVEVAPENRARVTAGPAWMARV